MYFICGRTVRIPKTLHLSSYSSYLQENVEGAIHKAIVN